MKIIENEPLATKNQDDEPFWHEFVAQVCKAIGIDPMKFPYNEININITPNKLPRITVIMDGYSRRELKPISDLFQAVDWKKNRGEK